MALAVVQIVQYYANSGEDVNQTVHTASISWAKGYCGAVIHESAQLVNSIKLPSAPRVALGTSVNLLTTTVKCLQMVNIAHQS